MWRQPEHAVRSPPNVTNGHVVYLIGLSQDAQLCFRGAVTG